MELRKNAGYVIIDSMTVGNSEFVLGIYENDPQNFVTWQCKEKEDYFWGHYHTNLLSAQKDFCKRALGEIEILQNVQKKTKEKKHER